MRNLMLCTAEGDNMYNNADISTTDNSEWQENHHAVRQHSDAMRLAEEEITCILSACIWNVSWLKGLQQKCSTVMQLWLYAYLNLTILSRDIGVCVAGKLLLLFGSLVLFCFILKAK